MKKNIIFDITHYSRRSWFWRVTREVINGFIEKYKDDFNIFLVWNNVWISKINWIKVLDFKWSYILFKFFQLNKFLKEKKQWMFFSFDNIFFWKLKGYKYITIIHDIWQERWYKENWLLYYLKKKNFYFPFFYWLDFTFKNFNKSDLVIVPSEYTKIDLIDFYKLNKKQEEKIKIVKWWVDHFWNINIKEKKDEIKILIPFPVVTKNNLDQIVWIINNIEINNIQFLWVKWLDKENILSKIDNRKNISFEENYISEDNLINYFRCKNICIYISDNDWFWFLPLECQYFWNPVLATNWTSIPYILWDSVEYINKEDNIETIINKIENMKNNFSLYSKKSIKNSDKYKWNNTIKEVYSLIKKI